MSRKARRAQSLYCAALSLCGGCLSKAARTSQWASLVAPCALLTMMSWHIGSCALFDQVIGPLLEQARYLDTERPGSLQIDYQLELDRRLHRKLARTSAPEDAIRI